MAKLTDNERNRLQELADQAWDAPPLSESEYYVAPTQEARARYIRFATAASRFFKGNKPVRFTGNNWQL